MKCELCGDKEAGFKQVVEGAIMMVCSSCKGRDAQAVSSVQIMTVNQKQAQEEVLVVDFGLKIKEARVKMGIGKGDLGSRIGIKESNMARIESGDLEPTDAELTKIERMLKIRLKEVPATVAQKNVKAPNSTLGDVVELK